MASKILILMKSLRRVRDLGEDEESDDNNEEHSSSKHARHADGRGKAMDMPEGAPVMSMGHATRSPYRKERFKLLKNEPKIVSL